MIYYDYEQIGRRWRRHLQIIFITLKVVFFFETSSSMEYFVRRLIEVYYSVNLRRIGVIIRWEAEKTKSFLSQIVARHFDKFTFIGSQTIQTVFSFIPDIHIIWQVFLGRLIINLFITIHSINEAGDTFRYINKPCKRAYVYGV